MDFLKVSRNGNIVEHVISSLIGAGASVKRTTGGFLTGKFQLMIAGELTNSKKEQEQY